MGVLVTATTGLVIWIVLWSLGAKGFDAFMITTALVLLAATIRGGARFLPSAGR